jgi:hypothetical protein
MQVKVHVCVYHETVWPYGILKLKYILVQCMYYVTEYTIYSPVLSYLSKIVCESECIYYLHRNLNLISMSQKGLLVVRVHRFNFMSLWNICQTKSQIPEESYNFLCVINLYDDFVYLSEVFTAVQHFFPVISAVNCDIRYTLSQLCRTQPECYLYYLRVNKYLPINFISSSSRGGNMVIVPYFPSYRRGNFTELEGEKLFCCGFYIFCRYLVTYRKGWRPFVKCYPIDVCLTLRSCHLLVCGVI